MVLQPKTNQKSRGAKRGRRQPTSQRPSRWNWSWLRDAPPGTTLGQTTSQARWLARDNPETNSISINPESASHEAEQLWVSLPSCPLPRCPFPVKSLALTCVSLDSSFLSVSPWQGSSKTNKKKITSQAQISSLLFHLIIYSTSLSRSIHIHLLLFNGLSCSVILNVP